MGVRSSWLICDRKASFCTESCVSFSFTSRNWRAVRESSSCCSSSRAEYSMICAVSLATAIRSSTVTVASPKSWLIMAWAVAAPTEPPSAAPAPPENLGSYRADNLPCLGRGPRPRKTTAPLRPKSAAPYSKAPRVRPCHGSSPAVRPAPQNQRHSQRPRPECVPPDRGRTGWNRHKTPPCSAPKTRRSNAPAGPSLRCRTGPAGATMQARTVLRQTPAPRSPPPRRTRAETAYRPRPQSRSPAPPPPPSSSPPPPPNRPKPRCPARQPEIGEAQRQPPHDRQPPRQQPRAAQIPRQRCLGPQPQPRGHQDMVRQHRGQRDGLHDHHRGGAGKPAQKGQHRQSALPLGQGQRQHQHVGIGVGGHPFKPDHGNGQDEQAHQEQIERKGP